MPNTPVGGNIRFPAAVWIVSAISSSKQDGL